MARQSKALKNYKEQCVRRAKNLLDPRIERTYGKNSNLIYSSYKKGMSFGLAFSYDF